MGKGVDKLTPRTFDVAENEMMIEDEHEGDEIDNETEMNAILPANKLEAVPSLKDNIRGMLSAASVSINIHL